jgi:hypothetical protein
MVAGNGGMMGRAGTRKSRNNGGGLAGNREILGKGWQQEMEE